MKTIVRNLPEMLTFFYGSFHLQQQMFFIYAKVVRVFFLANIQFSPLIQNTSVPLKLGRIKN
jgi:hypothetical protein